jgi:hypothetical protein
MAVSSINIMVAFDFYSSRKYRKGFNSSIGLGLAKTRCAGYFTHPLGFSEPKFPKSLANESSSITTISGHDDRSRR